MRMTTSLSERQYSFARDELGHIPGCCSRKTVCVSWRHFQEERWRIDEAGIKEGLKVRATRMSAQTRRAIRRSSPRTSKG